MLTGAKKKAQTAYHMSHFVGEWSRSKDGHMVLINLTLRSFSMAGYHAPPEDIVDFKEGKDRKGVLWSDIESGVLLRYKNQRLGLSLGLLESTVCRTACCCSGLSIHHL